LNRTDGRPTKAANAGYRPTAGARDKATAKASCCRRWHEVVLHHSIVFPPAEVGAHVQRSAAHG
jgi:hypothetical protein